MTLEQRPLNMAILRPLQWPCNRKPFIEGTYHNIEGLCKGYQNWGVVVVVVVVVMAVVVGAVAVAVAAAAAAAAAGAGVVVVIIIKQ